MKSTAFSLLALVFCASVQATTLSGTLTGHVDSFADPGNAFGLSLGDTITLDVVYDDSGLTGTGGETVFFNLPGNTMDFTVGLLSFDQSMDTAGGVGPTLSFLDGALTEVKYDTQFGGSGVFFSFIEFFQGSDDAGNGIGGNWDLDSFAVSAVPAPPALWLFGTGLVALAGLARRQAA